MASEVRVAHGVVDRSGVALAIRQVLEDGRDGGVSRLLGKPDRSREARAVGERNPHILEAPNLHREIVVAKAHWHQDAAPALPGSRARTRNSPTSGR